MPEPEAVNGRASGASSNHEHAKYPCLHMSCIYLGAPTSLTLLELDPSLDCANYVVDVNDLARVVS